MAFNFNWSPLTADAEFYKRARDLLTKALNKSPKPPIIVDDIFVTEFNLGSMPPELEILEIGDLAEDRFRGIFKMGYLGDAFLTLKTRVQANPLNTYLCAKPSFTSPQPLAASSGLTIPLQITLSDIKLSAFIILVFSKQKGLTLVFRNDPLESLTVSSTFDSIPFVRDYLQKTIEGKLRDLMMDELPAIIHKLSLQFWCPDQVPKEEEMREEAEQVVNPLATPPLDAVDANGHLLDPTEISSLSLDGGPEVQSLFSQKNLVQLAAVTTSTQTLSLFSPWIKDTMFRARAGPKERPEAVSTPQLTTPTLKSHSQGSTVYTFSDTSSHDQGYFPWRPSIVSLNSGTTGLSLGSGRHSKAGRKKKTRVVNLRRKTASQVSGTDIGEDLSDIISTPGAVLEPSMAPSILEETEAEPALTTLTRVRFMAPVNHSNSLARFERGSQGVFVPTKGRESTASIHAVTNFTDEPICVLPPAHHFSYPQFDSKDRIQSDSWAERGPQPDTPSTVQEQAWIMKMAGEIARRVYDEKNRNPFLWKEPGDIPPPAYEAA